MRLNPMTRDLKHLQSGASLIEVMMAMLLFSIGMLPIGLMLVQAVQLPKLAAYRATATLLASGHIERMRANRTANHSSVLNYDGNFTPLALADCTYPNCTTDTLSAMDKAHTQKLAREQLPAGGLMVTCDESPCNSSSVISGNLWLVWQEPGSAAALKAQLSDDCPPQVSERFTDSPPRCLYVRFSL
jgi:type IV pilus assembly protein PilV